MKGASGMLGDVVVYRQLRGELIMSNRPKKREVLTPHQEKAKARFKRAVLYAKRQINDPVLKAFYQPRPSSRFTSAYAAAVGDFLSTPKVHEIDTTRYGGAAGDEILLKATDQEFGLSSVRIAVFSAADVLLEEGDPVLQSDAAEDYVYTVTVVNNILPGTRIVVTVRDRPGNVTVEEKVL